MSAEGPGIGDSMVDEDPVNTGRNFLTEPFRGLVARDCGPGGHGEHRRKHEQESENQLKGGDEAQLPSRLHQGPWYHGTGGGRGRFDGRAPQSLAADSQSRPNVLALWLVTGEEPKDGAEKGI